MTVQAGARCTPGVADAEDVAGRVAVCAGVEVALLLELTGGDAALHPVAANSNAVRTSVLAKRVVVPAPGVTGSRSVARVVQLRGRYRAAGAGAATAHHQYLAISRAVCPTLIGGRGR